MLMINTLDYYQKKTPYAKLTKLFSLKQHG